MFLQIDRGAGRGGVVVPTMTTPTLGSVFSVAGGSRECKTRRTPLPRTPGRLESAPDEAPFGVGRRCQEVKITRSHSCRNVPTIQPVFENPSPRSVRFETTVDTPPHGPSRSTGRGSLSSGEVGHPSPQSQIRRVRGVPLGVQGRTNNGPR